MSIELKNSGLFVQRLINSWKGAVFVELQDRAKYKKLLLNL